MAYHAYAELLFETGSSEKAVEMATNAASLSDYYGYQDDLKRYRAALK